jgi:thiol-disulfide isomerase/thioredoxin
MKKTILLSVLAVLCLCFNIRAQDNSKIKPLKIGDQVPDIAISNIINYKTSDGKFATTAKISDFKDKILILDFWATWCSPCVAMIPKMNALQKEFSEKVQFLPVTYQSQRDLAAFAKRNPAFADALPEIFSDTNLSVLFPHRYLPHYVWIDAGGRVMNITGFEAVNAQNLRMVISGSPLSVAVKKDIMNIPYNAEKPLFTDNNAGDGGQVVSRTIFSNYVAGLPGGYQVYATPNNSRNIRRIVATNSTMGALYQIAYGEHKVFFGENRTLLNVRDSSAFRNPGNITEVEWMQQNHVFSYELDLPPELAAGSYQIMQRDLQLYFPQYSVNVQKMKRKCLALVRTSTVDKIKSTGGTSGFTADEFGVHISNSYLSGLIGRLNVIYLQLSPMPLIDKTDYHGTVDITLDANLGNVESINKALAAYDLHLTEIENNIDMLVISDKK